MFAIIAAILIVVDLLPVMDSIPWLVWAALSFVLHFAIGGSVPWKLGG